MRALILLSLSALVCTTTAGYEYVPIGGVAQDGLDLAGGNDNGESALGSLGIDLRSGRADASDAATPSAAEVASELDAADALNATAGFDKEYYTFTANEDDFHDATAVEKISNDLSDALRVVFVRGHEHTNLDDAALDLAKEVSEQDTDIYVLDKLADAAELSNQLNAAGGSSNSDQPEVAFVKYRTAADAANAQEAIKLQYDTLASRTQQHSDDVAPILNFASQAAVASYEQTPNAPADAYLPVTIIRF